MNWFRENRFLGNFLIAVGVGLLSAGWFLSRAKNDWEVATIRFRQTAAELNRLEQLAPYPTGDNLRALKTYADDYATALAKLKDELKARAVQSPQIAPNEFQSRLHLAMTAVAVKARGNEVKLPDKFYLGFDEFASSLPDEAAASLLGLELAQIEWFLDTLFESRIDALTSFRRIPPLQEERRTVPPNSTTATRNSELLERRIVEATFISTPAAARRVLNQVAGASQQFFIVRLLHVRNEKDKGPSREVTVEASRAATALNFIVGNERIETTVKIEIVRFVL